MACRGRRLLAAERDDAAQIAEYKGVLVAPVIANLNTDSATFTEIGAAVFLDTGSNALVTDGDSTDFDAGNLVTNGVSGEDVLAIDTSCTLGNAPRRDRAALSSVTGLGRGYECL